MPQRKLLVLSITVMLLSVHALAQGNSKAVSVAAGLLGASWRDAVTSAAVPATNPVMYVSYYVNETFSSTGAPTGLAAGIDDTIYIVNPDVSTPTTTPAEIQRMSAGASGISSASTSPAGSLCADIYVWDPSEELTACCSVSITPNELVTEKVSGLLTNPASARDRTPHSGVIKIIPSTSCNPAAPAPSGELTAWMLHFWRVSGPWEPTEQKFEEVPLSAAEEGLNANACAAFAYLSGAGRCTAPVEAPAVVRAQ
jgi:hypothetical protein